MSLFEYVFVHVTNTFRVSTLLKVVTSGDVPFFQIPDGERMMMMILQTAEGRLAPVSCADKD